MQSIKSLLLVLYLIFFSPVILQAISPPLPPEYGRVIINKYSRSAGLSPVVFDHWLHRAMFTCRLCHEDIGFAMKADTTDIKAENNIRGSYCGACHNGKMLHNGKPVFAACSSKTPDEDVTRCERCHSHGKGVKREYDFNVFIERLPRTNFGNGVDWVKAHEQGLIRPEDFVEGLSMKVATLPVPDNFSIEAKLKGLQGIFFSHKKHALLFGCEGCHPEIFPVRKGYTTYSMREIYVGQYCGVCHASVAFPIINCVGCHQSKVDLP
jgi:c(7)-type cytochrome triheme protein